MKKENIVLRIDTNMKTQFKKAVEKEGVSMSDVITDMIHTYINENDEFLQRNKKINQNSASQCFVKIYDILNGAEFYGKHEVLQTLEELQCHLLNI